MLYRVISVVCLYCPILTLPYFFISQQMECSRLPVCWRNLSQEHGCKLFSPVRRDFIFTAQQSSQCMLSCLSPRRIEKQDARRAAFQSFSSHFGFLWHPPSLHPLTSLCFVHLIILPRLHCFSQTSPHKPQLFRYVLIFRLIFLTNLIPKHYILLHVLKIIAHRQLQRVTWIAGKDAALSWVMSLNKLDAAKCKGGQRRENHQSFISMPECTMPVPLKTSNTQPLTSWQPGLMSGVQMLFFSTSPTISAHTGWMIIFYPPLSLNPISWKKVLCGTTPHQLFIPVFTPNPCGFLCILNGGKGAALPDVLILVIFIWCL